MYLLVVFSLIYVFYSILKVLFGKIEKKIEPRNITIVQNTNSLIDQNDKIIHGYADNSILTELGEKQAKELKDILEDMSQFDVIYCSPSIRALQTATICLDEPELIIDNDLRSLNEGDWEGKNKSDCHTDEVIRKIEEDPENFKAPNGESMSELETRILDFLFEVSDTKDKNILVFTHLLPIQSIRRLISNLDWNNIRKINSPDGGIIRLKREGNELELCDEESEEESEYSEKESEDSEKESEEKNKEIVVNA